MPSPNSIPGPAGRLTKRQRQALPVERSPITPEYFDAEQLAAALTVSSRTIEKWRVERVIPCLKVGHVIRFDLSGVKQALERHMIPAKESTK